MKKPSGRTMTTVFASVHETSDSDDEGTVGMDVELATPSSNPSPEQHVSLFFIQSIFHILVVIIICISVLRENFGIRVSLL
jgi:hypothetical protein